GERHHEVEFGDHEHEISAIPGREETLDHSGDGMLERALPPEESITVAAERVHALRRFVDPCGRHHLRSIPCAARQVELPELRGIAWSQPKSASAGGAAVGRTAP